MFRGKLPNIIPIDESDKFAKNYHMILNESLSFAGENSDYFAEYKIRDLQFEMFLSVQN